VRGRDLFEDLSIDVKRMKKGILMKAGVRMYIEFIWFRILTSGGLSWTQ
jgi:hypothetical protein